jgi:hypothetical protein
MAGQKSVQQMKDYFLDKDPKRRSKKRQLINETKETKEKIFKQKLENKKLRKTLDKEMSKLPDIEFKPMGDYEKKKGEDYGSFKGADFIRASKSGMDKMKSIQPSKLKKFKSAISAEKIRKAKKKK